MSAHRNKTADLQVSPKVAVNGKHFSFVLSVGVKFQNIANILVMSEFANIDGPDRHNFIMSGI